MKHILVMTVLLSQILACNQFAGYFNSESSDSAKGTAEYNPFDVSTRDMSITAENAYSDLFLDSTSIENYIKTENVSDSAARLIRNFYNGRNNQFAWFNSSGLTEQGRGFWNLYNATKEKDALDKSIRQRVDSLVENDSLSIAHIDSASGSDSSVANTEIALTHQFVQYALNGNNEGYANALTLFKFIPVRKTDVLVMADSILKRKDDSTTLNRPYVLMKEQLSKYYDVAQKGGWQPITFANKEIKKGASSDIVGSIKKRLQLTGNYSGSDTTQVYNDSLFAAIKSVQKQYGLDTTGTITDSLIAALNVPVDKRIEQIIINMHRMAWMSTAQNNRYVEVNIPEFMLTAYDQSSKAFDMPVIVGKNGTNTMMFSGDLNQLVFSPYWNVPQSIVEREIMPAMKSDASYLKKRNMEIVKKGDSIPQIRQLPGEDNAMGKVKFLFPNSYDVYLHDTPKKELFANDKRAFSNGCIRVADAEKLANFLLSGNQQWTSEKIKTAMNSSKEQYAKLDKPVPVMINYLTAWVDEDGQINFRDDVYGHDEEVRARMFTNTSNSNIASKDSIGRIGKDSIQR